MPDKKIKKQRLASKAKYVNADHNRDLLSRPEARVSFSFKYMQEDEDFHIKYEDAAYFQKVIYRLKDLCGFTKTEMTSNNSNALRCHPVDWNDKRVSRDGFGIPHEEDLCDEVFQVSVSSNEYGRIVGFFAENSVFNVVWFDRNHALYP